MTTGREGDRRDVVPISAELRDSARGPATDAQLTRGIAPLLCIVEAAVLLNVPESWLRKKVSARAVPFTLLGRHVRFTAEHLNQIVAAGEQRPLAAAADQGVSRRARRAAS